MKYTIPLPPITKKNSQQILKNFKTGKRFIGQSKQYIEYEQNCGYFVHSDKPIDYPVNVKCVYYMPTLGKVDLTNLMAATHDILVKYGVLADDNSKIVISVDGSRVLYDKVNPRTEISISDNCAG